MIITPLTLVFADFKAKVIVLQLILDTMWLIGIGLNFVSADAKHKTFREISMKYLKSGLFMIDFLSVFPALITLEKINSMSMLKFLRLHRFSEMFNPVKRLMWVLSISKQTYQI